MMPTALRKNRLVYAGLVTGNRQILHGGDETDVRFAGSALGSGTCENGLAHDTAALWLGAEAGATLDAAMADTLGGGHRHTVSNNVGRLVTVNSALGFLVSGHFLLSGERATAGKKSAAG